MGRGHPMLQPMCSSSLNLLNWVVCVHPPPPHCRDLGGGFGCAWCSHRGSSRGEYLIFSISHGLHPLCVSSSRNSWGSAVRRAGAGDTHLPGLASFPLGTCSSVQRLYMLTTKPRRYACFSIMLVLVQLNDDIASEKVQSRIKYLTHMRPVG